MNVSAVIVTRGDVDLSPVLDSLPRDWQKIVWDNSQREDLSVYGRYAAIEECDHDTVFVQDDDAVLTPEAIEDLVESWRSSNGDQLVANMPQRFRDTGFYDDHCLVGFGAVFHRDLPAKAFARFLDSHPFAGDNPGQDETWFERTCDIVFTALTPRILVDVPYDDMAWAYAANRMWVQKEHVAERTRMLELVRRARDRDAA